jgi:hypothetical protein
MFREEFLNQGASGRRERHVDHTSIAGPPHPRDEAAPFEVVEDRRDIRTAAEQLEAELGLRQRSEVQQRLEHAKLPGGHPPGGERARQLRRHRVGGSHELDVGVEREPLACGSAIVRAHCPASL